MLELKNDGGNEHEAHQNLSERFSPFGDPPRASGILTQSFHHLIPLRNLTIVDPLAQFPAVAFRSDPRIAKRLKIEFRAKGTQKDPDEINGERPRKRSRPFVARPRRGAKKWGKRPSRRHRCESHNKPFIYSLRTVNTV